MPGAALALTPARALRLLSNRYLRTVATLSHSVEQRVEWCACGVPHAQTWRAACARMLTRAARLYAFDVHCNAYFPLFIALYGAAQGVLCVGSSGAP